MPSSAVTARQSLCASLEAALPAAALPLSPEAAVEVGRVHRVSCVKLCT